MSIPAEGQVLEPLTPGLTLDNPNEPLTEEQARNLTVTIRNAVDVVWSLIARAHAGKAWKALGYDTWADYVTEEFDMSRSRSYQLLNQAHVVDEIEAVVPDGTSIDISEAAARDLKGVLEDVVPQIKEATEGLNPEEASDVLDEIVTQQREKLREERDAFDDGFDDDYTPSGLGGGQFPGGGDGSGGNWDGNLSDSGGYAPDDDFDEVDVVAIRRAVNAAHDLYSSLSALAGLPQDLTEVLEIIPRERYEQIDTNLDDAENRLAEFGDLWRQHREGTADTADGADGTGD